MKKTEPHRRQADTINTDMGTVFSALVESHLFVALNLQQILFPYSKCLLKKKSLYRGAEGLSSGDVLL